MSDDEGYDGEEGGPEGGPEEGEEVVSGDLTTSLAVD